MAAAAAAAPAVAASGPVGWIALGVCAVGVGVYLAANNKGGRSNQPIGKRDNSNTRKEAYEKAKRAGGGKEPRGPEKHNDGRPPHFHPRKKGTDKVEYTHDHYRFPNSQFRAPPK